VEQASERTATIRRGVTRLGSRLRAERPSDALAGTKVAVLGHLHRNGPSSAGAVAAAIHLQPQSLTRTLNELQLARMITRHADERDRRAVILALTEDGRLALRRDMASRDAWLEEALGLLTEAEAEILRVAAGLMERLAEQPAAAIAKGADTAVA
jgi:DNA-binding MarR family transcriptional regulator